MKRFAMPANRFFVLLAIMVAILASGLSAFAQVSFANRNPGQWVGDLFYVGGGGLMGPPYLYLIDENDVIRQEILKVVDVQDFPVPSNLRQQSLWAHWHSGGLHMLTHGIFEKEADGSEFSRFTFAKWQDDEWHHLGFYKQRHSSNHRGGLLNAIPCDDDRFIVVSAKFDLAGNSGPDLTPFSRMSIVPDTKAIRLGSSIYHGMDDLRKHMANGDCFQLAWYSSIVMTDSFATLISPTTGLYWIFSLETASLKRTGNIFRNVTPEMISKGGFSGGAVLCAHPEKDGTVLVSAQMENLFIYETSNVEKEIGELMQQNPAMTGREALDLFRARKKELADRSPMIDWYRIYPESGKVEKLGLPPEGGATEREGGKNDIWRPLPDGSVRMGPLNLKSAEPNHDR